MKVQTGRVTAEMIERAIVRGEAIMEENYVGLGMTQACLYWTKALFLAFCEMGVEAIPQAGTAMWRRVPGDSDLNAYGYEWQGDCGASNAVLNGNGVLPEMHAWIGLKREEVIIDMTSGYQEGLCKRLLELDWDPDCRLPKRMAKTLEELRAAGACYIPMKDATFLMCRIWEIAPWGACERFRLGGGLSWGGEEDSRRKGTS